MSLDFYGNMCLLVRTGERCDEHVAWRLWMTSTPRADIADRYATAVRQYIGLQHALRLHLRIKLFTLIVSSTANVLCFPPSLEWAYTIRMFEPKPCRPCHENVMSTLA